MHAREYNSTTELRACLCYRSKDINDTLYPQISIDTPCKLVLGDIHIVSPISKIAIIAIIVIFI